MNRKELVLNNYKRFCALEGSDYIASEFALETILRIVDKFKINNILELGLGIGSISDTVFKYAESEKISLKYYGTEKNEFCLNALKANVENFSQLKLRHELKKIDGEKKFDFIIIDGQDNSLNEIVKYCDNHAILFVEGDRIDQTEMILNVFPNALHVNIISLRKNKAYAHGICEPHHYVGGGQLIFTNPTLKMKVYWLQSKISTNVKRKLRVYSKS